MLNGIPPRDASSGRSGMLQAAVMGCFNSSGYKRGGNAL